MFMQPREIQWFDVLPLNPNGKIDRVALARQFVPEKAE
jgi:acyl-coenzyme A synthetase/AMP-(fatty) acid ligase